MVGVGGVCARAGELTHASTHHMRTRTLPRARARARTQPHLVIDSMETDQPISLLLHEPPRPAPARPPAPGHFNETHSRGTDAGSSCCPAPSALLSAPSPAPDSGGCERFAVRLATHSLCWRVQGSGCRLTAYSS